MLDRHQAVSVDVEVSHWVHFASQYPHSCIGVYLVVEAGSEQQRPGAWRLHLMHGYEMPFLLTPQHSCLFMEAMTPPYR